MNKNFVLKLEAKKASEFSDNNRFLTKKIVQWKLSSSEFREVVCSFRSRDVSNAIAKI